MKAALIWTSLLWILPVFSNGQVYLEKQTPYRFAQLNVGVGYQTSFGGQTAYLNASEQTESLDLTSLHSGRLIVGGTHFWGHADFYMSFPLFVTRSEQASQEVYFTTGVETVFKAYPWRIQSGKIRPYLGVAIFDLYHEQKNQLMEFGEGPQRSVTRLPLLAGLTYNRGSYLWELGVSYHYRNEQPYYISRTQSTTLTSPPIFAFFSLRYMMDTTLGAEYIWETGRAAEVTKQFAREKALDQLFLGGGGASAWWWGSSTYNEEVRPYLERFPNAVMPDLSIGYYWHTPDMAINLAYRGYRSTQRTFGVTQAAQRRSLAFEWIKFLADYHGFVPFIGPVVSYERLSFTESFEGNPRQDVAANHLGYGLTFGWDIRPNRLQPFLLRTNLRFWPALQLDLDSGQSISFRNVEFNFIQLIFYPGRMF